MSKISLPRKVKLIIGYIYRNEDLLEMAERLCRRKFGPADYESGVFDFGWTDYYQREFGGGLKRRFVSHERLVPPDDIYKVKLITNRFERMLSAGGKRRVNIDPGYISEGNLVLLTTKDYGHRVYLKNGIYAESTLHFRSGSYRPWEWTYPDYRTAGHIGLFNTIRALYRSQLGKGRRRSACR